MKLRERNQTLISVIINPNSQRINVNNSGQNVGLNDEQRLSIKTEKWK